MIRTFDLSYSGSIKGFMYVFTYVDFVCYFKSHITAQSGPVIYGCNPHGGYFS